MKRKPVVLIGTVAIIMVLATVLLWSFFSDAPLPNASRYFDHALMNAQQNHEVKILPEAMTGNTKLLNNTVQPGSAAHLGEQQVAYPDISHGLAPRPLYDYQRPEQISNGLKELIQQVHTPLDNLSKAQRQYQVEQMLEQLPYHVSSGEVHPQEATLLHMHLLQDKLGMDEQKLLMQVEEIANLYKSMSPLKVVEYQ